MCEHCLCKYDMQKSHKSVARYWCDFVQINLILFLILCLYNHFSNGSSPSEFIFIHELLKSSFLYSNVKEDSVGKHMVS